MPPKQHKPRVEGDTTLHSHSHSHHQHHNPHRYLHPRPRHHSHSHHYANAAPPVEYFLVIDFEATCDVDRGGLVAAQDEYPHEIIEFPCVAVSANNLEVVQEFHTFVRPTINPVLSPYCTNLTGIRQEDVTTAPTIHDAVAMFEKWVREQLGVRDASQVAVVCDGPWDMGKFLYMHMTRDRLRVPRYLRRWINLRLMYEDHFGQPVLGNLKYMMRLLGLTFEGQHHRGIDDARNISRMFCRMSEYGCSMYLNECLP